MEPSEPMGRETKCSNACGVGDHKESHIPAPQRRDRHLEVDVTQAVAGKNVIVESCSITWRKAGNASCGEERCKKEQRVGGQLLL